MRPRVRVNHGEYAFARRHKCQCTPCVTAVSKYSKGARYDKVRGVERRPAADEVRAHIEDLMSKGVQRVQIAHASGLADSVVRNIITGHMGKGPAKHVLRPTAAAILAVTYNDAINQSALVPSIGIHRRIQALEYMGHTKASIGALLGVSESMVFQYLKQDQAFVHTVRAVHDVYVQMRRGEGSSERNRWGARRRGWVPPMCWDDESIDDPATKPYPAACIVAGCTRAAHGMSLCRAHHDEVASRHGKESPRAYMHAVKRLSFRRAVDGQRLREEIRDLRALGFTTPAQVAYRLGKSKEYIEKMWEQAS